MSRPVDAVMTLARECPRRPHDHQRRPPRTAQPRRGHQSTPVLPDGVAFIHTTEEASRLLALCHAHRVPVVPFGAGTSLEGHVTPVRGGISIDLSAHDRGAAGERPRHGLPRAGRRDPAAAERPFARPGPVFPGRPRQRVHPRRHVRHPRQRHQRRPLRHHPGQRARPHRRARGRPGDPHRRPRPQGLDRLRPDPAADRLRGHARRHHRNPAPPARHPGGAIRRRSASSTPSPARSRR